ncbi:MAG: CapA family protein [Bacilli bacterium]
MKILIGGDFVPNVIGLSKEEKIFSPNVLDKDLINYLNECDINLFNCEAPITDSKIPTVKCGQNIRIEKKNEICFSKIQNLIFSLANNHILDFGSNGIKDTLKILKKNNIEYFGAGENLEKAKEPLILEKEGYHVGLYSCTEAEFSSATEFTYGANPMDTIYSFDDVSSLKKKCDFVIVLYHGGKEFYPYPSPILQKICRRFIEKGADLVICQHSHCIGCVEDYKNGKVVYGQGNFLFEDESEKDNEMWKFGLLIEVNICNNSTEINYKLLENNENFVQFSNNEEQLQKFKNQSAKIKDKDFIQQEYIEFSKIYINEYLYFMQKGNKLFLALNKFSRSLFKRELYDFIYPPKVLLSLLDIIMCEAHQELLIEGLKTKIYKK